MSTLSNHTEAECLELSRLLGMSGEREAALVARIVRLETAWHDFFHILDITEESDSGREFRPTRITSCRSLDASKLELVLERAKKLISARN